MPVVTPINAPPEPSSFVLMVSGLMTMGIYFLATRKQRQAASNLRDSRLPAEADCDDGLLQTELAIEQDLATIQETVREHQEKGDEAVPRDGIKADKRTAFETKSLSVK